jgi:hypothetical protein
MHFTLNPHHKFRPEAVMVDGDGAFTYDPERKLQGNQTTGFIGVGRDGAKPGKVFPSNVLPNFGVAASGTEHSAAFPVKLPEWFVRAFTDEGDRVYDPFGGSGTTIIAAHRNNRVGLSMELSERYCDVICERWQRTTGEQPVLERTGEPHDFTT